MSKQGENLSKTGRAMFREAIDRMQRQLERAESRNADLRAQLEMAALGKVKAWTPFERCNMAVGPDGQMHQLNTESYGGGAEVWRNNIFTVTKWDREFHESEKTPLSVTHLSIKRNDGAAIRDWRHFQRIKNELCGPEREGVEIFPAESRLVDGANQWHVWVLPVGARVPFGFGSRLVSGNQDGGVQQRPWEPGQEPGDAQDVSIVEMADAIKRRGILA